jgi:hypothetical protein
MTGCGELYKLFRCREGSKKHRDDPVPHGDFRVLHCRVIGSSLLGIGSDWIGKYVSKI